MVAEEQQVVARRGPWLEFVQLDAVVDGGDVLALLVPVGVAERDVLAAPVVSLEGRDDLL